MKDISQPFIFGVICNYRCSTGQLKSLATTLEPVFHRDFINTLKDRYPSASLKKIRKRLQGRRRKGKGFRGKYVRKVQRNEARPSAGKLSRQQSTCTINEEFSFHQDDGISRETTMDFEDNTEAYTRNDNNKTGVRNVEQFADLFVNNIIGDVIKTFNLGDGKSSDDNLGLRDEKQGKNVNHHKSSLAENKQKQEIPSIAKLDKYLGDLKRETNQIQSAGILLKHHNSTIRGHNLERRAHTSNGRILRAKSSEDARSMLIHEAHASVVATPDMKNREFFEPKKGTKLGKITFV